MTARGIAPVVGFTVLVGLGAMIAVSILVASGAILGDLESSAESQQVENSMTQFAQTADRLATGAVDSSQFHVSGDAGGSASVDESAGHVEFTLVHEDGTTETLLAEDLGVYRHEFEDGTEVAYQGGGVWTHANGDTGMVSAPALQYRSQPDATLTFPLVRVTGDRSQSTTHESNLRVTEREALVPGEIQNPIVGSNLYVDIESRYCEGWETYVDERTDGTVEESCAGSDVTSAPDELRVNMTVSPGETSFLHERVGLYSEGDLTAQSGDLELNATLASGGDIELAEDTSFAHEGEFAEGVDALREPHDEEIADLVDEAENDDWETLCAGQHGNCEYEGGQTVYVDDFDGGAGQISFDLADGDLTLVVDDDVRTLDRTEWRLENYDEERSVEVYATGDLRFEDYTTIGPDGGPNSLEATDNPPDDTYAEGFQFYLGSDASIEFVDTVHLETVISAPSAGTENQSMTHAAGESADINLIGALYAGHLDFTDMSLDVYQPAHLGAGEVDEIEEFVGETPDLYYLHLSEVTLEVEG